MGIIWLFGGIVTGIIITLVGFKLFFRDYLRKNITKIVRANVGSVAATRAREIKGMQIEKENMELADIIASDDPNKLKTLIAWGLSNPDRVNELAENFNIDFQELIIKQLMSGMLNPKKKGPESLIGF